MKLRFSNPNIFGYCNDSIIRVPTKMEFDYMLDIDCNSVILISEDHDPITLTTFKIDYDENTIDDSNIIFSYMQWRSKQFTNVNTIDVIPEFYSWRFNTEDEPLLCIDLKIAHDLKFPGRYGAIVQTGVELIASENNVVCVYMGDKKENITTFNEIGYVSKEHPDKSLLLSFYNSDNVSLDMKKGECLIKLIIKELPFK
jgi:hypothetical protein